MLLNNLLEKKVQSNVSSVTLRFLKKLNIPVTATTIVDTLEQHPDYPSLYSISESLKKWNVENMALKVDSKKIEEIPIPFIAYSKTGGGNFILVNSVNGVVEYIDEKGKVQENNKEEFQKQWDNIVLLAQKNEQSGEKDYSSKKRREIIESLRIPFLIAGCLLLIVFNAFLSKNVLFSSLTVLNFAGCIVTGLLLWFEVDKSNPVIQQICSGGKHTNCTAVLSSKPSKLFNFISWSEVGFFYFAGGFLFLLLTANRQLQTLSIISWINLLALPYTIFSVLYQWRIAKQWCPLCLAVQAILVLEFIVSYFGFWQHTVILSLSRSELIPLLTSFLLPVFFWAATKKVYLNAQNGVGYKKELAKLKYNKEIFNALLSKQKQIATSAESLGIMLGNPTASNTIIKVCNPYCGPCAKAHTVIDEILESNDDVKVQIIFMANDDDQDKRVKPVRHLMALYQRNNEALIKEALDEWYGSKNKDYDSFALKYAMSDELQMQGDKIKAMDNWTKRTGISFTPTFFVNGYQLPGIYKVEDLKHLL